jgi:23S rRNA pseudoU1915 N3-methylase RlmH
MGKLSDKRDITRAQGLLKAQKNAEAQAKAISNESFQKHIDVLKSAVITVRKEQVNATTAALAEEKAQPDTAHKKNTLIFIIGGLIVVAVALMLLKD